MPEPSELDPGNADAWYHLGVSYLEQVEADARVLLSRHRDSAYVEMLMAETFAEQRAFIQAEEAYKKVLAFPRFLPARMPVTVLSCSSRHDLAGAERELNAELAANPGSSDGEVGHGAVASGTGCKRKGGEGNRRDLENRPGFCARQRLAGSTPAWLVPGAASYIAHLRELQASGDIPPETAALFDDTSGENAVTGAASAGSDRPARSGKGPAGDAAQLYARGSYGRCRDVLASRPQPLAVKNLQLLASCAYLTGDYSSALKASGRLAAKSCNRS